MIRQCVKNIIFDSLNYDIFRFEDFVVSEGNSYSNDEITISYNEYYYRMHLTESDCRVYYNPGVVLTTESGSIEISQFENRIGRSIHAWLDRVKRDLLNPIQERYIKQSLQEFQTQLEEKLAEMKEDEAFTSEERKKLKERLDALEQMILETYEENAELEVEISKMRQEIEFLKNSVETLTKKKWLRNALTKFYAWSQKPENRKLIEAGAAAIKLISQIDFDNLNK